MYNCIAIDDDQHTVDDLVKYVKSVPQLQLYASYTNSVQALMEIQQFEEPIDLIILDVEMPNINGIELAKEIRNKTKKLMFITAHTKYAFDAYQLEVDHYLLKPFSLSQFLSKIDKLFPFVGNNRSTYSVADKYFFVKSREESHKIFKINYTNVVAVEGSLNHIIIHAAERKIIAYMSLSEIAKVLEHREEFVRFQRSFIINEDYIESIDCNLIKMTNHIHISVGKFYKKKFQEFVSKRLLIKRGEKT